ncbi:HIT family protein [Xylophilus sp. GOD-11R]|uniref:HIT family protein n=1 Tax=Xylophilus sp. GOD-11R TaxID=3089814 RepID=UPI00298CDF4E|nr:HIT family protein [Xylophilus sp. GOD-11R]WPB55953.1 HIT family protein [Xylophilus sp. GOD-11R]
MNLSEVKKVPGCALCEGDGGVLVWAGAQFRLIRAEEPGFPAFYRVVWADHVAEFSDLSTADRALCMEAVALCERTLRSELRPEKINLAALGNMVPHLHWHVVARFEDDSHFPAPLWAAPLRERDTAHEAALARRLPAVDAALATRFSAAFAQAALPF